MGHRTQYYFLSFPCSVLSVACPLTCQMAPICLPQVQLVYSLCEYDLWSTWPRSTTQYSLFILFLHNHQTNFHSISTLSCFCFKISNLSVNTGMLLHLCLNKTSNGELPFKAFVCVFSGLVWSPWKVGDGELGILSLLSVEVNTKTQCASASNQHNDLERVYSIDFSTLC